MQKQVFNNHLIETLGILLFILLIHF